MHEPSQAIYANKQEINTLLNVTVQHTVQKVFPHITRMQVWNALHVARWKIPDAKMTQKSPSGHHRTTLSDYIFATKARIDNRKKLVKQQYLLHMSSQYGVNCGPLTAEIVSLVWGTPANFNGFRVLATFCTALQYWASAKLCGVSQTRHLYSAGQPTLAHVLWCRGIVAECELCYTPILYSLYWLKMTGRVEYKLLSPP